jgi:hypothetical protein
MSQAAGIRRDEGIGEVRVLGGLLAVLLVGAYLSWTKKEETVSSEKVTVLEAKPDDIQGLRLYTKTQTVSVERRTTEGEPYVWFEIETGTKKRSFVGNKTTSSLFESFGPFVALRSLGSSLTKEQLDQAKLEKPESKLVLRLRDSDRTYEVGGRTYGARDWYVRATGQKEVYLVASRVLSDIEFPEGRFMQRKLRNLEDKDVTAAVLKAGPREKRMLHQNRLSDKDAYWADAAQPDAKNETIENWLDKLTNLNASTYLEESALKDATPVFEVAWFEEDEAKERVTLYRVPDGDKQKYLARSTATRLPVEVPRSTAEQLEQDLAVVLAD